MKYSILGFNQEKVLQFQREEMHNGKAKLISIDVIDLIILREISDFMNRKRIIKYIVDDKTFCYVKYSVIIDDLPIINIKQQALVDRLDKLCSFGFLEKHVVKNQAGSFPAFRIGEAYEMIAYSDYSSHTYQNTSANVSKYKCNINTTTNNNIENINQSTINKKEKEIDKSISKKGNKFDLDMSFVDETFMPIVLEWLEYKKEKKQSYKQRGFNTLYKNLLEMCNGNVDIARKIVNQSMQNNYAGLFPLKQATKYTQQSLPVGMIIAETQEERNEKFKNEKGW